MNTCWNYFDFSTVERHVGFVKNKIRRTRKLDGSEPDPAIKPDPII
ncbi:MAG: hypothetical protein SD837_05260 [Candidatus Electrothrix scaldis]|nr:MAG: hypothetical protein SD837_05260 [Candidatus Electrothrix sp. GW3-3]